MFRTQKTDEAVLQTGAEKQTMYLKQKIPGKIEIIPKHWFYWDLTSMHNEKGASSKLRMRLRIPMKGNTIL